LHDVPDVELEEISHGNAATAFRWDTATWRPPAAASHEWACARHRGGPPHMQPTTGIYEPQPISNTVEEHHMTTEETLDIAGAAQPTTCGHYRDYVQSDVVPARPYLLERRPLPPRDDYTVDAARYTSPDVVELEFERLWSHVWQLACRENDIPAVGDYIEYQIMDISILLVRSDPTTIKGFRNSCRHRGATVAAGSGNVNCFRCPYHGWSYGLDGTLRHVPAKWEFDHLRDADARLHDVRVDRFDGFVFVNLSPDAEPLDEFLGTTVRDHMLQTPSGDMHTLWHFEMVLPCNWKVGVEAFMESYHVARTHPQIAPFVPDIQVQCDSYGYHARALAPFGVSSALIGTEFTQQEIMDAICEFTGLPEMELASGQTARAAMTSLTRQVWNAAGVDLSRFSDSELQDELDYLIFPNSLIFRQQAGHQNFRFRPNGKDPNSCIFDISWLQPVPPAAPRPRDSTCQRVPAGLRFQDHEPCVQAMGVLAPIVDQDLHNFTLIQNGLHGAGELILSSGQEALIVDFERNLDRWLEDHA
jgi:phenylpropionate dioxygenase-like ring-hydroxylating dioxygenase large terminal subunit